MSDLEICSGCGLPYCECVSSETPPTFNESELREKAIAYLAEIADYPRDEFPVGRWDFEIHELVKLLSTVGAPTQTLPQISRPTLSDKEIKQAALDLDCRHYMIDPSTQKVTHVEPHEMFVKGAKWARETLTTHLGVTLTGRVVSEPSAETDWKWEYENLCKFANDYQNRIEELESFAKWIAYGRHDSEDYSPIHSSELMEAAMKVLAKKGQT